MQMTTSDAIPGREIAETVGLVTANAVHAGQVGRDISAGFKSLVGGKIGAYQQLLIESREDALAQLEEQAANRAPTRSSRCA